MADITYSPSDDHTETIFSASTPKGEKWMGEPETTIPNEEAQKYKEAAEAAGLSVHPFP